MLDDDLSQPCAVAGDSFRISALQKEDPICITLSSWISSGIFHSWTKVKGLCPELRLLWHHHNNLTVDDSGIIWLSQCVVCVKSKSPTVQHHPLGNIPTGHRWDRMAMDILDVCDPTPDGYRYILVIADYFSKWTEAFPMKNKCADTVADILVEKIILRFGMPLVIHSDQGREFENGLMKSLCALLGCTKTRTAPYHPESDGMIKHFNRAS